MNDDALMIGGFGVLTQADLKTTLKDKVTLIPFNQITDHPDF